MLVVPTVYFTPQTCAEAAQARLVGVSTRPRGGRAVARAAGEPWPARRASAAYWAGPDKADRRMLGGWRSLLCVIIPLISGAVTHKDLNQRGRAGVSLFPSGDGTPGQLRTDQAAGQHRDDGDNETMEVNELRQLCVSASGAPDQRDSAVSSMSALDAAGSSDASASI